MRHAEQCHQFFGDGIRKLYSIIGAAVIHVSYVGEIDFQTLTGFIRGILRGVRYAKSLRVLFLHRRSPSWTTLVLYSRAVFIFNEPTTLWRAHKKENILKDSSRVKYCTHLDIKNIVKCISIIKGIMEDGHRTDYKGNEICPPPPHFLPPLFLWQLIWGFVI